MLAALLLLLVASQRTYTTRSTPQLVCHQSRLCHFLCPCLWVDLEVGHCSPAAVPAVGPPARRCRPSCRPTATGDQAAPAAAGHCRDLRRPSSNDDGRRRPLLPDDSPRLTSPRSTKPARHLRCRQIPVKTCWSWSTRRTVSRRRPLPRCFWFQTSLSSDSRGLTTFCRSVTAPSSLSIMLLQTAFSTPLRMYSRDLWQLNWANS